MQYNERQGEAENTARVEAANFLTIKCANVSSVVVGLLREGWKGGRTIECHYANESEQV